MTKKSARYSDAASIVGEEIAADLEARSQQLVGRVGPTIDPGAVVLKEAENFPPGQNAEAKPEGEDEAKPTGTAEEEAPEEKGEFPYGGAKSIGDAEAFLIREKGDGVLLGDWELLAGVLTNIVGLEHSPAINAQLKEFQSKVDVMAVKALADLKKMEVTVADKTKTEPKPEDIKPIENGHPLDVAFADLRESYDEALATPVERNARLRMIQPTLNRLGEVIRASASGEETLDASAQAVGITQEQLNNAVTAAVAPLMAELQALRESKVVERSNQSRIPTPRAARFIAEGYKLSHSGPVPGATARVADELGSASGLGGFEGRGLPPTIGYNDLTSDTKISKLSALIRRSVGIRD